MEYETNGFGYLVKKMDAYKQLSEEVNHMKRNKGLLDNYRPPDVENVKKNLPRILKECKEFEEAMIEGMKVSQKTMEKRIDF